MTFNVLPKAYKSRFSLLLLEPSEIYFEDFNAYYYPPGTANKKENERQKGWLKLCSKSVVFDPREPRLPVLRFPFNKCKSIIEYEGGLMSKIVSAVGLDCSHVTEMLEGNILKPYNFKKFPPDNCQHVLELTFAKAKDCVLKLCQLHRASTLTPPDQDAMIAAIAFSRQSRCPFNHSWLDNLYEEVVMEVQGSQVTPFVVNPGRVLLSKTRIYFQPYNNVQPEPVIKLKLSDIKQIVKRRFLLRHIGLEFLCKEDIGSLYLSFLKTNDRNLLYDRLLEQWEVSGESSELCDVTLRWQNRAISNYEYLIYLNSISDRSVNDLTQYPVMPWVISDYQSSSLDLNNPHVYRDLSKPVGALNPNRLKTLKDRYDEMIENKFLFGSHYSTPGFVLFYLARKYPQYVLCLQNGRFDHSDRMFNSVSDAWKNVTSSTSSDFKELIPEFYDCKANGDFLVNGFGIDFGSRHDGRRVTNVDLPPWAEDPSDFVRQLRDALESEFVSNNLHNWIDLIFGFKQQGEEAEKANNVFYHLCYEGSVDLDTINDANQRHALEVQIMEFGQIPTQLFTTPHPPRGSVKIPRQLSMNINEDGENGTILDGEEYNRMDMKECLWYEHHGDVTSVALNSSGAHVFSTSEDGCLKIFGLSENRQLRQVMMGKVLAQCVVMPDDITVLVASWDNCIMTYNVEFGRLMESCVHSDAVCCLGWSSGLLVTGSWDCTARVWMCSKQTSYKVKSSTHLKAEWDHESSLSAVHISQNGQFIATGTVSGQILIWETDRRTLHLQVTGHSSKISGLCWTNEVESTLLASCSPDGFLRIQDGRTGAQIVIKDLNKPLRCLAWDGTRQILIGCDSGDMIVFDRISCQLLHTVLLHSGGVSSIVVSEDRKTIVTGGLDHKVSVWR